jgi:hypothetical protein
MSQLSSQPEDPDEAPIATSRHVPRNPHEEEEADEDTVKSPDEAPIATATRVA